MENLIAVICLLIITVQSTLKLNSNYQQEYTRSETETPSLLSNTNNVENKIISIYEKINYIDDKTFFMINDSYSKIDFRGCFNQGDISKHNFYKKQFNRLLKNETTFTQKDTGEEFYINEFGYLLTDVELGIYDLNKYTFYFFDVDGDETPELCITDKAHFTYIIKYDEALSKFTLWQEYDTPYLFLMGTRKLGYGGNARRAFFYLDQDGNYDHYLWIREEGYTNSQSKQGEYCILMTFPQYVKEREQIELTDYMKEIAFFDENQKLYYFRVTDEQYNKLTENYLKAQELASENLKEVTFTYNELFDEF